jgi:hypothetical protein
MLLNFLHCSIHFGGGVGVWFLGGSPEDMVTQYLLFLVFYGSRGGGVGGLFQGSWWQREGGCYKLLGRFQISVPCSALCYVVLHVI